MANEKGKCPLAMAGVMAGIAASMERVDPAAKFITYCVEAGCSWWNEESEACAVTVISYALTAISAQKEPDGS